MKTKVLFLCTGNSCRSQMAEGFLRSIGGERFEDDSAGTYPSHVNPLAIEVMREKGIDISQHRSKNVAEYLGQHFPTIVTVCDNAKEHCPIFPGPSIRLHWPLPDPADATGSQEDRLAVFRAIRDQIEAQVQTLVDSRT
jgi:arsenate reductase (thioredoxin)